MENNKRLTSSAASHIEFFFCVYPRSHLGSNYLLDHRKFVKGEKNSSQKMSFQKCPLLILLTGNWKVHPSASACLFGFLMVVTPQTSSGFRTRL